LNTTGQDGTSVDMDMNAIRAGDNAKSWRSLSANCLHNSVHEADRAIHRDNSASVVRVHGLAPIGEGVSGSSALRRSSIWAISAKQKRVGSIIVAAPRWQLGAVNTMVRLNGDEASWASRHDFSDSSPGWRCGATETRVVASGHWRFIATFPSPGLDNIVIFEPISNELS
jgi:hypothetical protein